MRATNVRESSKAPTATWQTFQIAMSTRSTNDVLQSKAWRVPARFALAAAEEPVASSTLSSFDLSTSLRNNADPTSFEQTQRPNFCKDPAGFAFRQLQSWCLRKGSLQIRSFVKRPRMVSVAPDLMRWRIVCARACAHNLPVPSRRWLKINWHRCDSDA